ncbi:MAG: succinyl-diaminopimelate desuccinylase [Alphaproteobacteria bacterium]|nr:succinyl-diaminopimelate desuccinylase [Alphaproteobacteria bacterium]
MSARLDPVRLAQELIRCPSVTPADAGALDVLAAALERIGMRCHRLPFAADGTPTIDNLYARIGTGGPHFCFAGHTDVVPVGDRAAWSVDPFGAEIIDGRLYGRGAVDMKSAIAAFAAAAERFLARRGRDFAGSISLLVTGDEEGPAINGTVKMLAWLKDRGETIDACVVGEPTNPRTLGDMVKIGRRGSLVGTISVQGVQGHTAYPHLADNPLPRLVRMLTALADTPLDQGTAHFQPSNLQLTTIDVGNTAANVIPARARAVFNIRFNDLHSGRSLERWLRDRLDAVDPNYALAISITGESFLTPPGPLSTLLVDAIRRVTGRTPELSTTGGTSDARFIKDHCAVAEFGLSGETMHKVDERVALADIAALADIYETVLDGFFPK